jgi:lipopolysaccharide transport system ATP-binding protein
MDMNNMEPRVRRDIHMSLRNVSLSVPTYLQHQSESDSWARILLGAAVDRPTREMHTILDGIDLDVSEGDRLALIGRNGAGKTSLLHVLTGCFLPTGGTIEVRGQRQALLNVTLGFNPEATVRENIFLRGAAMGLAMESVKESVTSILQFAEIEPMASQRLLTLSAGQRMRLGFAISTCVQPDIMLLDEWIGTGDAQFMKRARERMEDRVHGSRIMVLASHSADLLKRVCNRGLVMEAGRVAFEGSLKEALMFYSEQQLQASAKRTGHAHDSAPGVAFKRVGIPLIDKLGIAFSAPVHCLANNLSADKEAGTQNFKILFETEDTSAASVLNEFWGSLQSHGFFVASFQGTGLPEVVEFSNESGATAKIKLTQYRADEKRVDPRARARVHVELNDWPLGA